MATGIPTPLITNVSTASAHSSIAPVWFATTAAAKESAIDWMP